MKRMRKLRGGPGRAIWLWGALCVAAFACAPATAQAQEGRLYLRGDATAYRLERAPWKLSLGPFLKNESRFREQGLVLEKVSVGMKAQFVPWLSVQAYYAHKDVWSTGHAQKHMAVGDVIVAVSPGAFRLADRSGNEWHATDGFYRYRNDFEVLWRTPAHWLAVWGSEELRVDSDQERVTQNDVALGLQVAPTRGMSIRPFYDIEHLRRGKPRWVRRWYVGLSVAFRVGDGERRSGSRGP